MNKEFYREYRLKDGRKLVVRTATAEDSKEYSQLLHCCGAETDNLSFGVNDCPYTEEFCSSYLKALNENPSSLALLAFVDDALVGELTLSTQQRRLSHTAELGICILEAYWQLGIGNILIDLAVCLSREAGLLHSLFLTVNAENEVGLHLYRKYGFQEYGRYCASTYFADDYHDTILMNLYLK